MNWRLTGLTEGHRVKTERAVGSLQTINLREKFSQFQELWSPKLVAELNGQHVRLVKLEGEFIWHSHAEEDELFLVIAGELVIELREGADLLLGPGELAVIPRGVEHRPVACRGEVQVMLFEPASTQNTGDQGGERTALPTVL